MRTRRQRAKRFTLIEIMIGATILTVLVLAIGSLVQTSAHTSNLVYEQSRVQLDAQRILRSVRDQLRMTGVNGTGNLTYAPGGTFPVQWQFRYKRLLSAQIWSGGFDAADPYSAAMIPWETNDSLLKFELTEGASDDNVDNDGDFLVDEGRIALYRDVAGVETLVSVLGTGITAATIDDTQMAPTDPTIRPRIGITLTVQRVLRAAVRNSNDVADLTAGNGPRVQYTATTWVTLPN